LREYNEIVIACPITPVIRPEYFVRSIGWGIFTMPNNNEFCIADQRILHGPQGAKNNKAAAGSGGQSADKKSARNDGLCPKFWTEFSGES